MNARENASGMRMGTFVSSGRFWTWKWLAVKHLMKDNVKGTHFAFGTTGLAHATRLSIMQTGTFTTGFTMVQLQTTAAIATSTSESTTAILNLGASGLPRWRNVSKDGTMKVREMGMSGPI